MKSLIKGVLSHIRLFKELFAFRERYNNPKSVSMFLFLFFNVVPYSILPPLKTRLGKRIRNLYIPRNKYSEIYGNIFWGKCSRLQRPGCYIQGRGKLYIGNYVEFASNCVVITGNHDLYDQDKVVRKETIIGDYCWIAANASIMAGVVLGPRTIVAAGAVVTKSFPEGYCVIGGNPAKVIKTLDKKLVNHTHDEIEFYGYIPSRKFKLFYQKYLSDIKFDYDISFVSRNSIFS